jgi:hypothetical protein
VAEDSQLASDLESNTNTETNTDTDTDTDTDANASTMFAIFRYGLFALIIFFPCFRGLKVWYQAGGRIMFRRTGDNNNSNRDNNGNDNVNNNNNNNNNNNTRRGWIIGLRYQPADRDQWLILSGYGTRLVPEGGGPGHLFPGSSNNGNDRKLTEEEVYALPEIRAPKPSSDVDGDGDIELGTLAGGGDELAATYHGIRIKSENESSEPNNASSDASVEATDAFPEQAQPSTVTATSTSTTTPATTTTERLFTTTMSTGCSICIDDFEEGEIIRLLPRCGHAFHTECILPWLTEKQGCCPTCKALVICPEVASEETKENEDGNEERTYPSRFGYANNNIQHVGHRG